MKKGSPTWHGPCSASARYGEAYQRGQRVTVDTLAALVPVTPGA